MPKKTRKTVEWVNWRRPQTKRIKIAQPGLRPLQVPSTRSKKEESSLEKDVSKLTVHRRGIKREKIGPDQNERRAQQGIKGFLQERIFYKALIRRGFQPGIDFDFQSSQLGGRMELGGLVADFLFFFKRIVVNIQGPTHSKWVRIQKDQEQRELLELMGYRTIDVPLEVIMSERELDQWMYENIMITMFASIEAIEGLSSYRRHTQEEA